MKNKKYLIFVVVFCIVFAVIVSAATISYVKTIEVTSGINLSVDGKEFIPKDVYGNQVEVFNYNGTVYVPIRAMSQAFGKTIDYDGNTLTAIITSPIDTQTQAGNLVSQDDVIAYGNMMHLFQGLEFAFSQLDIIEGTFSLASISLLRDDIIGCSEYIDAATEMYIDYSKNAEATLERYKTQFIDTNVFPTYKFDVFKYFWLRALYNFHQGGGFMMDAAISYGLGDYNTASYYLDLYQSYMANYRQLRSNARMYINYNYNALRHTVISGDYSTVSYAYNFITIDSENKCRGMQEEYDKNKDLSEEEIARITGDYIQIQVPNTTSSNNSSSVVVVIPKVTATYSFPLHLYSNDGKTYLGKCVTDEMDDEGIYYKFFGDYSSKFSDTSIWNTFSEWGSRFYDTSAFNERATNPPKIVDNNGNFIGYLTTNSKIENAWTIEQLRQFLVNNNQ